MKTLTPEEVLLKKIKSLEKRRDKLNIEISNNRIELKRICTHVDKETKEEHISGSYYNRAQYITKIVCNTCDTVLSKKTSRGDFA